MAAYSHINSASLHHDDTARAAAKYAPTVQWSAPYSQNYQTQQFKLSSAFHPDVCGGFLSQPNFYSALASILIGGTLACTLLLIQPQSNEN